MATSGWETFGNVLGGGIDRVGAFETGRLRTAQTESALGLARERQLKNIAAEKQAAAIDRLREQAALDGGLTGALEGAGAVDVMEAGFGNVTNVMDARLGGQEYDFRDTLGNPEAPLGDQFAAGQGVQGKVLPRYAVTGGVAEDLLGEQMGLFPTPTGEADIAADNSLAALRDTQRAAGGFSPSSVPGPGGFGKEPPKYKVNPAFDPTRPAGPDNPEVVPVVGGAADVNSPRPLGMNALTQFARVLNAAGNTALDLTTIVAMPSGASMGMFGSPGKGLLSMVPGNLANQVSAAEVQQYRAVMGTLGEQLSTIERTGMRGSQGLADRFNDLALLPTDDVFTKMLKLAQMRQTVENGMDTLAALNSLPSSMLERTQVLKNRVATAIPFTPRDVLMLQQSKDPNLTLGGLLEQNGVNMPAAPAAPAAPGAAPAAAPGKTMNVPPPRNDKGWELLEDAEGNLAYVSPDGQQIEEVPRDGF